MALRFTFWSQWSTDGRATPGHLNHVDDITDQTFIKLTGRRPSTRLGRGPISAVVGTMPELQTGIIAKVAADSRACILELGDNDDSDAFLETT